MYTFMEFSRCISLPTHNNDFYFVDREFLSTPIYIYIYIFIIVTCSMFFPVHSVLCRIDGLK